MPSPSTLTRQSVAASPGAARFTGAAKEHDLACKRDVHGALRTLARHGYGVPADLPHAAGKHGLPLQRDAAPQGAGFANAGEQPGPAVIYGAAAGHGSRAGKLQARTGGRLQPRAALVLSLTAQQRDVVGDDDLAAAPLHLHAGTAQRAAYAAGRRCVCAQDQSLSFSAQQDARAAAERLRPARTAKRPHAFAQYRDRAVAQQRQARAAVLVAHAVHALQRDVGQQERAAFDLRARQRIPAAVNGYRSLDAQGRAVADHVVGNLYRLRAGSELLHQPGPFHDRRHLGGRRRKKGDKKGQKKREKTEFAHTSLAYAIADTVPAGASARRPTRSV